VNLIINIVSADYITDILIK